MTEEFKILIASDNHLGYLENDPIRGDDSFRTFEEILNIAIENEVDMVLLGGDLFHDSNPSRECLHRTMQILRNKCVGDRPVSIQVLSSPGAPAPQAGCKEGEEYIYGGPEQHRGRGGEKYINTCTPKNPNFTDPNYNISLPVYTIHGNHDDPTGKGPGLSPLDLLADANLINYFGKTQRVDDVTVVPILLRKGSIGVALYGLGNIRNERLYRTLENGKFSLMLSRDDEMNENDWFNILVVHQNRVSHSPKSFFPQDRIPNEMNFVLWGHEHDCQIGPSKIFDNTFLSQPGSSIAASLTEKESEPKHVGLLKISKGKKFVFSSIKLKTNEGETDKTKVEGAIMNKVESMIEKGISSELKLQPPLIRLKVDCTGFPKPVPQTFGKQYIGRVANHASIISVSSRQTQKQKSISVLMATGGDVKDAYNNNNNDDNDGNIRGNDPLLANVDDPLERSILGFLSSNIANKKPKFIVKNDFFDVISSSIGEVRAERGRKSDESNKFIRNINGWVSEIVSKCNRELVAVADTPDELARYIDGIVREKENSYNDKSDMGRNIHRDHVDDNNSIFIDDEASASEPPPSKRRNTNTDYAWSNIARVDSSTSNNNDEDNGDNGDDDDDDLMDNDTKSKTKKTRQPSSKKSTRSKKQQAQLPLKNIPTIPASYKSSQTSSLQSQGSSTYNNPPHSTSSYSIFGSWGIPNKK